MRVLIVNDTSDFHCGSASVIQVIKNTFSDHSITSLRCSVPRINFSDWDNVDHIIVNGEGTLHNNRQGAISVLNLLQQGLDAGCTASIVNSIWQNMDTEWKKVTDKLCVWNVRDRLSQLYAEKNFGRRPVLTPDYSYFANTNPQPKEHKSIVFGGNFDGLLWPDFGVESRINIFESTWNQIVNECRHSDIVVSGRHHEIYASCVAQTPFVALQSNSWKNQGLVANANSNLPVLEFIPNSLEEIHNFVSTHKDEYQKIFNWLNQFTLEDVQAHLLTR